MVPTAITYIVAGLGVFCLVAMAGTFIRYHRNRNPHPIAFSEILVFLNWVDIEGLRKLIDPMEEAFLRQSLTRIEFGKLQAERIRGGESAFPQNSGQCHRATKLWIQTPESLGRYQAVIGLPSHSFCRAGADVRPHWNFCSVHLEGAAGIASRAGFSQPA